MTTTTRTSTTELPRQVADRMAGQLTGYLTGPAQDRAHWTRRVGADGRPFWTTSRAHRWWAVHLPDPAQHSTAAPDIVDVGFLAALGQALAAVAAAEQRPVAAVITDILTTTGTATAARRAGAAAAPRAPGAGLADQWPTHNPRPRAPRVIARPVPDRRLEAAIATMWARAYRQGWRHQMHTQLLAEGAAALARLAKQGDPPPPPLPRDPDQTTRLYDQITTASVENYLTRHGWRPLDQTATVRRWHNGTDATVDVPTSSGPDRQAVLRATAYTLADHEQREAGEVLVELTDPPLRDPHLAHLHLLLTNPPAVSDTQIADRLATTGVPTPGGQMPLAEAARHQVEELGAADVVWKAATAAGQADAAARAAQLLGTTPPDPAPPQPVPLFANGPADPAEQVAARIWAAGTGLSPAQHARWFAHTWWPYHLTGTTRAVAAFLAARLGRQPPAHAPARGGPGRGLFTAIDRARPERSSHDRFVAAYRIVDAAARPYAVQAATEAIRDHLTGADLPVDQTTLTCAAVHAADARRFAPPPSAVALRGALTAALPANTDHQPAPATSRPRRPSWPPPWKALAGAGRPGTPGGTPLVVDPASHRQRQLVADAAAAVQNARLPTPPPTRAASTTRRAPR